MTNTMTQNKALLTKLLILKAAVLILAMILIAGARWYFAFDLPYFLMLGVVGCGAMLVGAWALRLRLTYPASDFEMFLLLVTDAAVIFALVNLSGGSANPFTSSLLIPLALAAAFLPKRYSVVILVLALLIYAWWTLVGHEHEQHGKNAVFSLHLYGMWVNFMLSAVLLFVFIIYAMDSLHLREKQLQQARERILRDEQVVALGALTANTAHALGTPLSTMAIIIEDWEAEGELSEQEALLKAQIAICKKYLVDLRQAASQHGEAGQARSSYVSLAGVATLLEALREHFQLTRPDRTLEIVADYVVEGKMLLQNRSLHLALVNLIENALQSGSSYTRVCISEQCGMLNIAIEDDGCGIDPGLSDVLGRLFINTEVAVGEVAVGKVAAGVAATAQTALSNEANSTTATKSTGLGIGFYLSNSTIEQFGGTIRLTSRNEGGTLTLVALPLEQ